MAAQHNRNAAPGSPSQQSRRSGSDPASVRQSRRRCALPSSHASTRSRPATGSLSKTTSSAAPSPSSTTAPSAPAPRSARAAPRSKAAASPSSSRRAPPGSRPSSASSSAAASRSRSPLYPPSELAWFGDDAGADTLILSADLAARAADLAVGRRVLAVESLADGPREEPASIADIAPDATALLLYTSGTTGKPKGAMITHENLAVQAALLREAWGFREDDRLLHALPLHHLHGLGISLLTTLLAGSAARMLPASRPRACGASSPSSAPPPSWPCRRCTRSSSSASTPPTAPRALAGPRRALFRLATSGSAALPVTSPRAGASSPAPSPRALRDDRDRRGHEQPARAQRPPPRLRRPGAPHRRGAHRRRGRPGLLHGPRRALHPRPQRLQRLLEPPRGHALAFADGWFKTGDIAEREGDGAVRLLGRTSVDILKSGGYKLSALEIEEALRDNPAVAEVAVIGLPDEVWGDRVVAVIVPASTPGAAAECATEALRAWAKERLAPTRSRARPSSSRPSRATRSARSSNPS